MSATKRIKTKRTSPKLSSLDVQLIALSKSSKIVEPPAEVAEARRLLDAGANVDCIDPGSRYGLTPLINAARCNYSKMVALFIERGADVDLRSGDGLETPLITAMEGDGNSKIVDLLLKHGADVNAKGNYQKTALHWTAGSGFLDAAKLLIKAGANVNAVDVNGAPPLIQAAMHGHVELVKLLVENGAKVNLKGPNEFSALYWAINCRNDKIINYLKKVGAKTLGPGQ